MPGLGPQAFVVAHTGTQERTYELRLAKGSRSRLEEDTLASKLVIRAVADSAGVGSSLLDLDQDLDLGSGMEGDESQLDELQVRGDVLKMGRDLVLRRIGRPSGPCAGGAARVCSRHGGLPARPPLAHQ